MGPDSPPRDTGQAVDRGCNAEKPWLKIWKHTFNQQAAKLRNRGWRGHTISILRDTQNCLDKSRAAWPSCPGIGQRWDQRPQRCSQTSTQLSIGHTAPHPMQAEVQQCQCHQPPSDHLQEHPCPSASPSYMAPAFPTHRTSRSRALCSPQRSHPSSQEQRCKHCQGQSVAFQCTRTPSAEGYFDYFCSVNQGNISG